MSFSRLQAMQLDLLEYSFDQIKPHSFGFTSNFYTALFTDYPQIKSLFTNSDIMAQYEKLMDVLILIIQNLRTPDTISGALKELAIKHFKYGVLPEHYPMLGKSLLKTLAYYLGSNWTSEMEKAWADAYSTIVEVMLEGCGYSQQILQVSSAGSQRSYWASVAMPKELGIPTTTANASGWEQLPYKPYNRPLVEILTDLSKPIPDGLIKTSQHRGAKVTFLAMNVLTRLLNHIAPGWEGFVISSQMIGNCSVVSYRITIHSAEGTFSRESLGSSVLKTVEDGDIFTHAEAKAFINTAAKWGLAFEDVALSHTPISKIRGFGLGI